MNFSKLKAALELLRPLNTFIVFLTIAAASIVAGGGPADWQPILLAALAGALIAASGYAINDYFDVEIDAVNRPQRPLPRGALRKAEAWWIWRLCSSAGVVMSAFVGPVVLAIALFWVLSLYFYSRRFKKSALVGNLIIGLATGLAFVYGGAVVAQLERSFVPAMFAFLINLARELVKDVEDREGDAKGNARTLPVQYGVKPALVLATLTLLVLIGATLGAYQIGLYNRQYLAVVGLVDASLIVVIVLMWRNASPSNMHRLSTVLKVDMLVGLVAIYLGSSR
ncbi:MAG: geranylgeranylglycerol-phosphate geranylgeranyltransferase [Bacteroidota bacterium]